MSRTDARRGRTEADVRLPHRRAGVSRGHSRSKLSVRSSGTLTRKGRNSQDSHDRERAAEGPNDREGESDSRLRGDRRPKTQYPLAFRTEGRGETGDRPKAARKASCTNLTLCRQKQAARLCSYLPDLSVVTPRQGQVPTTEHCQAVSWLVWDDP